MANQGFWVANFCEIWLPRLCIDFIRRIDFYFVKKGLG
jgi:hypothetical protein